MTTKIKMNRWDDEVTLHSATGNLTMRDLINSCEDQDFSLNIHVTGHLMLLDDRLGKTFMLNDYGIDVIHQLNEIGNFSAKSSILEYSLFSEQ